MKKFKGTITQISCSPHGKTEGLFLDDKMFVKIPPHTLQGESSVKIGDEVTGSGDVTSGKNGKTVKHARVFVNGELFADDQMEEEQNEEMKKRHKKENESLKLGKEKIMNVEGEILAVSTKKHGEIDRVLLEGGISIHVPKELDLHEDHLQIGDYLIVEGEGREFDHNTFIRADFIMNSDGQILSI